ncbi:MAG: sigma-70 family RNA polymerase sigma factor [Oscillospiraceae bacterium]|jgi:RNA polymerase sigma-70 factor (ECF subfamily)|nr:sigma-70 family RNA polymerase sigma factor [Oscillospiraceae bacterium]MBQ5711892.1 sigma-70 family RNA polymerase sigma factor [Oscillospiraceae bacterium]
MDEQQEHLLETLYLQLYERLFVYARSCLGSAELAEEAVQETFRIACQVPEKLFGSPDPAGWLVLTQRNVILRFSRDRRMLRKVLEDHQALYTQETAQEPSLELMLLWADRKLSEDLSLLWAYAVEGRSHRELARERDITVECCRKRLQRARDRLKERLGAL